MQKKESGFVKKGKRSLFDSDVQRDTLCFDLFFNDGPFGLIILDNTYRILNVNSRLAGMLGLESEELEGAPLGAIMEGEDALKLKSFFLSDHQSYSSLIANMLFFRRNLAEPQTYITYVKRYNNDQNETHYCILLFEQDFSPTGRRIERDQRDYDLVLEIQEQERQYIGSLLHDSVAQLLYAIRLNLQYFMKSQPEFGEQILSIKTMLNQAISSIRDFSMDLNVSILNDFGLKLAIESMAARVAGPDFSVKTIVRGRHDLVTPKVRLTVYRITQELLNNSMKHSQASKVEIKVWIRKTKAVIEVRDNGCGFSLDDPGLLAGGSGLRGILARIKSFSGELCVDKLEHQVSVNVTLALDHSSWEK
ncbi:MAG: ATP-binding protein [Sphingobacterium sp.]